MKTTPLRRIPAEAYKRTSTCAHGHVSCVVALCITITSQKSYMSLNKCLSFQNSLTRFSLTLDAQTQDLLSYD